MDKPKLSPDIETRIAALCKQISVAHEVDAEIQRELRGHMEDKLFAYLAGEEVLSEEDAFILVREHFGNPGILKEYLRHVHKVPATLSLARRLLAVMTLTVAVSFGFALFARAAGLLLLSVVESGAPAFDVTRTVFTTVTLLILLAGQPLVIGLVLRHWQRRLDGGAALWTDRLAPPAAAGLGAATLIVWSLRSIPALWILNVAPAHADTLSFSMRQLLLDPVPMLYHLEGGPAQTAILAAFLCLAIQAALWFWWCDRPPRVKATLNRASAVWLGFFLAPALVESLCTGFFFSHVYRPFSAALVPAIFIGGLAMALYRARERRMQRKALVALSEKNKG